MAGKRKQHASTFKAQVARAAVRGPTLIHDWKKRLLAGAAGIFEGGGKPAATGPEGRQAELFEQIGRLKMELEWVKKKAAAFG